MRIITKFILFALLIFFSCTGPDRQNKPVANIPLITEARGYVVPNDSISNPRIIPAGGTTKIRAGKPEVVYTNTNQISAGNPAIVLAGIPQTNTPGQYRFLIPKKVPAIDNSFFAGIPEVETAKDAYIQDRNPQNFSTFGKNQGLKYSSVNCQLQDENGNLWFCTYGGGVSKYDGKSFTHYTEKEGLSNNRVWSVLQDNAGNLWFGTDGGGVSKYDGKLFTNYTENEGLINNSVLSILQDKDDNIWFATIAGVSKYDGKSFTQFTKENGLCENTVLSVLEDKSGNIWFGTSCGVSKYDGKSFTNFTVKEGLVNNSVLSVFQDSKGTLWFGTYGGVSKYDGKSFTNYTEKEGLSNDKVYCILEDANNAFWFATGGGGVSKLELENNNEKSRKFSSGNSGRFTHFTVNEGLCNNLVYSILLDNNKNLWFGTNGGVCKYGGKLFTHFTRDEGLNNNKVYSICQDKTGNLWLGTFGGGISKYDGKSFTRFTVKEGLSNNYVFSILQDRCGNLWFGTDGGGVSRFDGTYFTHFTKKEGLSGNKVFCILQDKIGNLWFGTYGGGVTKYDGKSFTHFTKKDGLCNNNVISIFQDNSDNLWFGTDGGGVSKLILNEPKEKNRKSASEKRSTKFQFINYTKNEGLSNNYITSIFQDKNQNIWFGTGGGGVLKYDGRYFTQYTENEGLSNDYVLSVFQDKNNNLWFGTRFGLSKFKAENVNLKSNNQESHLFINYEYEDGFLGIGCTRGTVCQDKDGNIWMGTNDRLTVYHSDGDIADTIAPNIQLTGIDLFNEKISWSNLLSSSSRNKSVYELKDTSLVLENGVTVADFRFNETSKWHDIPQNLSLKYNNNFLTFRFIGISQIQSKKIKYKYQLVGLDKNWSAATISNEASYGNLAPGTYTFKVKALNGEGIWSKEFAYSFSIRSPWWGTGIFRLFIIVLIITSLFVFYRWRVSLLKRRQKYLEQVVEEKTVKVVTQSRELKVINQALMLQKEELEIANATKDKFFSIIAHDLRSPFNGFLGLTEIMAKEVSSLSTDTIQKLALSMNKSATNLYHLLENLLQWSQLQKGAVQFNPVICHLRSVANQSIAAIIEPAKNKKIEIVNEISDELEIWADFNMIQTIFRNLVSNAMKFTSHGGAIVINARRLADNYIEISIIDSGIGISQELQTKLFRIDEKTSRRGTNDEPSTGLGLILCKEFVERHLGQIWVQSEPGKGSAFYFTIHCKPKDNVI